MLVEIDNITIGLSNKVLMIKGLAVCFKSKLCLKKNNHATFLQ